MDPFGDTGRELDINLDRGRKEGGRIIDDGEDYQAAAEQGCKVHCYVITVRPVWGVGKGSRGAIKYMVVETGGNWPGRGIK